MSELAKNPKQIGGDHYSRCAVQPFDLQRAMESSGSAFVDGCRCMIIKYAFRKKGDLDKMAEDMEKLAHYAEEAAKELRRISQH